MTQEQKPDIFDVIYPQIAELCLQGGMKFGEGSGLDSVISFLQSQKAKDENTPTQAGYAAAPAYGGYRIYIKEQDHLKTVFVNGKGDTYTTKSEELLDFLHGANVAAAPAYKGDDWIDAKLKTPPIPKGVDYSQNVLAICNGGLHVMAYCYIEADEQSGYAWCNCNGDIFGDAEFDDEYKVTHWMPLPSPPTATPTQPNSVQQNKNDNDQK